MVRHLLLAICVALLTLPGLPQPVGQEAFGQEASDPVSSDTIRRIGLSLPLSGSSAFLAGQFRQGAELAVEMLAPEDVELVVADDGCTADLAELSAADLRSAGVLLVTGLLCNDAAYAAARAFRDSQVPVLVAGARSDRLLRDAARQKWPVWRLAPSDRETARAAFDILSKRWTSKPWAIVDDGTVTSRALADEFRALMEEAKMPPITAETYRPAQSSFVALMRRLERAGVAAAFVAGSAEDVAAIAASGRKNTLNIEWVGGPDLDAMPTIADPATAPEGLLAVLLTDPLNTPAAGRLEAELASRNIEPEPYVLLGYAAAQIAIAAASPSVDEARQTLKEKSFDTVLGTISFGDDGASDIHPYALHEWRNGAFHPISAPSQ